jgi:hypothetical protein
MGSERLLYRGGFHWGVDPRNGIWIYGGARNKWSLLSDRTPGSDVGACGAGDR